MSAHRTLVCILALAAGCSAVQAQERQPVTPRDCVTVRYFSVDNSGQRAIQINPQGTKVAYLVKSPNLERNRNDIALYVANIKPSPAAKPRLLLSDSSLAQMQWLADGEHILVIANDRGRRSVVKVNVENGAVEPMVRADSDIVEYSSNADGTSVVFATEASKAFSDGAYKPTSEQIASGYRISVLGSQSLRLAKRRIFFTRRIGDKFWAAPKATSIISPFTKKRIQDFPYFATLHLSLSPDGKTLLISYADASDHLPAAWQANQFVKGLHTGGFPGILPTVSLDLETGRTRLALASAWAADTPLWSRDGSQFAIFAESPVGSIWEQADKGEGRVDDDAAHLFSVDWPSGVVHQVALKMTDISKQPLGWGKRGDLIVHSSSNTITRYGERNGIWSAASSFDIPLSNYFRFGEVASDGIAVAGDYENAMTPPELFLFDSENKKVDVLARLNPQFDRLTLAPMREIKWTTETGYQVDGFLFVPPDYRPGIKYPLVIQTKPDQGQFVCDTGFNHYPSFAPQPMANAGMMYLVRTYPENSSESEEKEHYPKGYPGGIAEAAFQMDVWDSAVKQLAADNLIDKNEVGIIGFSRSGWYTEFILTHSPVQYRAATLADNAQYDLLEYWLIRSRFIASSWEAMYGGPPYGQPLENWIKYSVSFNLDKIHAAVLMEEMGYGVPFDNARKPPLNLVGKMDVFAGLTYLNKPVELYYYPNEEHQPDDPKARLASLQRNLDWYRFWLQGYERPNPEDADQYIRWREMRKTSEERAVQTATTPGSGSGPTD